MNHMKVIGDYMDNILYRGIDQVLLTNETDNLKIGCLYGFEDYCNEIIITSGESIDSLKRGWVGDMVYKTYRGVDSKTGSNVNGVSYRGFKDVLLARINVVSSVDEALKWTYTFLKD